MFKLKVKRNRLLLKLFFSAGILFLGNLIFIGRVLAYQPPIGIPDPGNTWDGGLHPIDTPVPSTNVKCPNWPNAESASCYYIDNSDANCTNSSNTYGYPDKPRCELSAHSFSAGTYVEFHGNPTNTMQTTFSCTATDPCWIVGKANDRPVFTGMNNNDYPGDGRIILTNSSYVFVDGLEFAHKNAGGISIDNSGSVTPSHHIALRNLVAHDYVYTSHGSVFGAGARDNGIIHDVVFDNVGCHHLNYPYDGLGDSDLHCVVFGRRQPDNSVLHNIWWLDSNVQYACGSGIQVNGWNYGQEKTNHIYIGRITGHHVRQRIIGIKESADVIVSQNNYITAKDVGSAGGVSEIFGWAESPHRVWFLFNTVHATDDGWRSSQPDEPPYSSSTTKVYLIGNKVYDINFVQSSGMDPYDPQNEWRYGQGVDLKNGSAEVYVVDNTFYNTWGGVLSMRNDDNPTHVYGNVFNDIHQGDSFVSFQALSSDNPNHSSDYNVFYDPDGDENWRKGSVNYNFSNWHSLGFDVHSLLANPLFTDSANGDFHLQLSSPAKDINNSPRDVYALFYKLYGIDIRKDFDGNVRPQGAGWDAGAFESPYSVGPVRSHGLPMGPQDDGTTSVTISLETATAATCRYSSMAGIDYNSMTNTFNTTGNKQHSQSISVVNGQEYNYYVRCTDGNSTNDTDYKINFRIDNVDTTPPVIVKTYPRNNEEIVNHWFKSIQQLRVITDEDATCKYSASPNIEYNNMLPMPIHDNGPRYWGSDDIPQEHGHSYTYYVRCRDTAGNTMTSDYVVTWSNESDGTGTITIRADVDQQNGITSTDAMLTLRNSLGLDMAQTNWQVSTTTGDVNCDGNSNSTDAMLILRKSLGLDMSGTGWCN